MNRSINASTHSPLLFFLFCLLPLPQTQRLGLGVVPDAVYLCSVGSIGIDGSAVFHSRDGGDRPQHEDGAEENHILRHQLPCDDSRGSLCVCEEGDNVLMNEPMSRRLSPVASRSLALGIPSRDFFVERLHIHS